jgi:glycosyltransferase involved in cell wall biosynthesis
VRILKVSQAYYPFLEEGGPPAKIKMLAEHLAARRHQITVLTAWLGTRHGGGASAPRRTDSRCAHSGGQPGGDGPPFPVTAVYLSSLAGYRKLTVNPGVVSFCLQRLRRFDVVHIYGTYDLLGPVVAAFSRRWRIPYVLEPVGMFRPIVRNVRLKRIYRSLLGWSVVRGAARIVATSELERDELLTEGVPRDKLVLRRNGLNVREFEHLPPRGSLRRQIGIADDMPLVLYLGRLSRKKGLDVLLMAFSGITPPATLAILGPDDGDGCAADLQVLRGRLGLRGRVHLLGPRFGREKLAAFSDADIFVLPSRNENFGNAAAEAAASGVPVVVTDCCGIAPLVRERAGLVVSCEAEALRAALARLIADRGLRDRLRRGAVEVRRALSWDEPVAQMEAVYMQCAQVGRSPAP